MFKLKKKTISQHFFMEGCAGALAVAILFALVGFISLPMIQLAERYEVYQLSGIGTLSKAISLSAVGAFLWMTLRYNPVKKINS